MGDAQLAAKRADPMRFFLRFSPQPMVDRGGAQMRLRHGGTQGQKQRDRIGSTRHCDPNHRIFWQRRKDLSEMR